MLIAHLPMGYLEGHVIGRAAKAKAQHVMFASLLGNMIPDIDMLYFYLIDGRKTHHHDYITHWPLFWIATSILLLCGVFVVKRTSFSVILAFCIGTMLHMFMDTVAAPIRWLAPFNPITFEMVQVPATSSNWIISFITHWTFAIEIAITLAAISVFFRSRKKSLLG